MREWIWETPDWEAPPWSIQIRRVAGVTKVCGGGIPLPEVIDFYNQVWDSNAAVTLWLLEGDPVRIAECICDGEDPTMVAPDIDRHDPLLAVALDLEPILARKAEVGACMHDGATDWPARLLELHAAIEHRLAIRILR